MAWWAGGHALAAGDRHERNQWVLCAGRSLALSHRSLESPGCDCARSLDLHPVGRADAGLVCAVCALADDAFEAESQGLLEKPMAIELVVDVEDAVRLVGEQRGERRLPALVGLAANIPSRFYQQVENAVHDEIGPRVPAPAERPADVAG